MKFNHCELTFDTYQRATRKNNQTNAPVREPRQKKRPRPPRSFNQLSIGTYQGATPNKKIQDNLGNSINCQLTPIREPRTQSKQTHQPTHPHPHNPTHICTHAFSFADDGRMDGWMDGRTDGRMDGRMDARMDARMDGWIVVVPPGVPELETGGLL